MKVEDIRKYVKSELASSRMSPEKVAQILRNKEQHIPNSLFKYRTISSYSTSNLLDKTLWCDHPNTFNDPYDCAMQFTVAPPTEIEDLLDDARMNLTAKEFNSLVDVIKDRNLKLSEDLSLQLTNKLKGVNRICSLSERIDSMLMWSHYASDHKAFAMEYEFNSFHAPSLCRTNLWPVIYEEDMLDVGRLVDPYGSSEPGSFNNIFGIAAVIQKALDWQYEREWRIVLLGQPSKNVPAPLKAIYLGARIAKQDRDWLIAAAEFIGIPAFQMKLASRQFRMTFEPIKSCP